jgi:hypothetical protein
MKKIINGKKYNTETATMLADRWNGRAGGDFGRVYEELYRKKTGEYFIYGEGGAMTKYSMSAGNNCWTGGEMIIPLTEAEAREWAEKWVDADKYEEIFGEVEE